jgi:drug/metabolite transporter (DMT)-like permease
MDVFMMLGVFIPLSLSALLFDEHLSLFDLCGVLMLVIAVLLMCSYQGKTLGRLDPVSFLLLALCGIANGTADLSQKLFVQYAEGIPVSVFNFYSYTAASLLLGVVTLFVMWRNRHGRADAGEATVRTRSLYLYVAVMAACLFANSYFKTLAAGQLTAVVLYPMTQGLSLITSAGMSALFFREKVTLRVALALLFAFLALLCINFF